jgi:hypothetical protein
MARRQKQPLEISFTLDVAAMRRIANAAQLVQSKVAREVLTAMGDVVEARGKRLAPRSTQTHTRDKWGKKYKSNPRYQNNSADSIGKKYLPGKTGGIIIVGGLHPKANKMNFTQGKSRVIKLWGRAPVNYVPHVKVYTRADRFMQVAYDETKLQQAQAGHTELEKQIKELNLGN